MKTYDITQKSEIVLYGFNVYTKKQIKILMKQGFFCRGIIDCRADELKEYQGIKIVSNITELENAKDVCVFIMLQNAFMHIKIAELLYQQGICKVLFIPMERNFFNRDVQTGLIIQYNNMLQYQYDILKNIPYLCSAFFQQKTEPFCSVAMELQTEAVVWVSAEKLFTTLVEPGGYNNVPIVAFEPYRNLFDFLSGKQADIHEYISLFGISALSGNDKYREILIKRKQLFDYFEYEINRGFEYFIASAPKAQWNEMGYLNLCEGQHRCVYLLNKGFRKIPVRIDYNTLTAINILYSQYCWSNEMFQYMIVIQRFFGKEKLCNKKIMCSQSVAETVKENLQCCMAVLTEQMEDIDIYFDYDEMITNCLNGVNNSIVELASVQCKMIVCLEYQNNLMRVLQREEKNYQKKELQKLIIDFREMELCIFELKDAAEEG